MTASSQTTRHDHLRANPATRRSGYWTVIWLAIAIAVVSAMDMLFLQSALFWGVVTAYAVLVTTSVLLFFSRRSKQATATYGVAVAQQPGEVTLRCTECDHRFLYDEQTLRAHTGWMQACPSCGLTGPLPSTERRADQQDGSATGSPAQIA